MTNHPFISTRGLNSPITPEDLTPTSFSADFALIGGPGMDTIKVSLHSTSPIAEANDEMFPDIVEVEPTPQEKFNHAMKLVQDYGIAVYATNSGDAAANESKAAKAHDALFQLFWDIYGLDNE